MKSEPKLLWPKITLAFCGIMTAIVLLGFFAMFAKSVWQFLSLPLFGRCL